MEQAELMLRVLKASSSIADGSDAILAVLHSLAIGAEWQYGSVSVEGAA